MDEESFYMYLNSDSANKAVASNVVPYHYSKEVGETNKWKVAVLRGKVSKTWTTIPNVYCKIEKRSLDKTTGKYVIQEVNLEIPAQRMLKISEMTSKLRETLNKSLVELGEKADDWVKFGGSGTAARKIVIQPGVTINLSDTLQLLLRLKRTKYQAVEAAKDIYLKGDYLNNEFFNVLYLICPNIEGVYANNGVIKAIADITGDTNTTEAGDSLVFHMSNPTYHKWNGDISGKIEVYLANSLGQPMLMNDGFLFVVLHFVKI